MTVEGHRWKVTRDTKERVRVVRAGIEKERRSFQNTTQPCPTHGDVSNFVRRDGAFTRGFAIFKCPRNHEFKVG